MHVTCKLSSFSSSASLCLLITGLSFSVCIKPVIVFFFDFIFFHPSESDLLVKQFFFRAFQHDLSQLEVIQSYIQIESAQTKSGESIKPSFKINFFTQSVHVGSHVFAAVHTVFCEKPHEQWEIRRSQQQVTTKINAKWFINKYKTTGRILFIV